MRDIRPYVCTFADCAANPEKLYSSQRTWFEHELAFHRRQWNCPRGCPDVFSRLEDFEKHLASSHGTRAEELSPKSLARGREIMPTAEATCPFCSRLMRSRKRIKSHIGAHQRQIALMALCTMRDVDPDSEVGEESGEDSDSDQQLDMPGFAPQTPFDDPTSSAAKRKDSLDPSKPLKAPQADDEPVKRVAQATHEPGPWPSSSSPDQPRKDMQAGKPVPAARKGENLLRPWILMPDLDHPFRIDGRFRLGQVLEHPRDVHGLLSRDCILPIPEEHVWEVEKTDWKMLSRNNPESTIWGVNNKTASELAVAAEKLISMSFVPERGYIDKLLTLGPISESLRSAKSRSFLPPSSRKLYLVTGLRVASNCTISRRTVESSDVSGSIQVPIGEIGAGGLGYSDVGVEIYNSGSLEESSHSVEGPVIFAYTLRVIKISFLGNLVTSGYEKGDTR